MFQCYTYQINFEGESKSIEVSKTFNNFIERVKERFNLHTTDDQYLDIKYTDDEGDQIAVSNEFDYEQAKNFLYRSKITTLKFNIWLKNTNDTSLREDIELLNNSVKAKGNREDCNSNKEISNEEILNINKVNSDDKISTKNDNENNQNKDLKTNSVEDINNFTSYFEDEKINTSQTSTSAITKSIHLNIGCDGCNVCPIIGDRYKCTVCKDFDYCEKCEDMNKDVHTHPFIKIRNPDRAPKELVPGVSEQQHHHKVGNVHHKHHNKHHSKDKERENKLISLIDKIQAEISDKCKIDESILPTIEIEENKDLRKQVKLINSGPTSWTKFYTFVCLNSVDKNTYLKGNDITMKVILKSGDSINVEIFIPAQKIRKGKYTSIWQMRNDKNEYFGEQFNLTINVIHNEKIDYKKKMDEFEELHFEYGHQLKLMKTTFELIGIEDKKILTALKLAKGNIDEAFGLLF